MGEIGTRSAAEVCKAGENWYRPDVEAEEGATRGGGFVVQRDRYAPSSNLEVHSRPPPPLAGGDDGLTGTPFPGGRRLAALERRLTDRGGSGLWLGG